MPSLGKALRSAAEDLLMEGVLESVRGYLEEKLRPVTPEHLSQAIDNDVDPWERAPSDVKSKGRQWAQKLSKHRHMVTPQVVLDWLREDRPDLYLIIANKGPKGTAWLVRWTHRVKAQLWPATGGLVLTPKREEVQQPPQQLAPVEQGPPKGTVRMG